MTPEEKLQEMGIELPTITPGHPAMAPGVITGNLLYLSGATPPARNGQTWSGRVGETYTVEEGYQAARLCAIQQLAQAKAVLGDRLAGPALQRANRGRDDLRDRMTRAIGRHPLQSS